MAELAPLTSSLPPATDNTAGARTTLGSLATAMIIGALITIALLYMWGAQIAKEERGALMPSIESP